MYEMKFTITFSLHDFTFSTQTGYDTVNLIDGGYTSDIGKPMIPVKDIRIALPESMKATTLHILDIQEQPIDGKYVMYPAQPAQRIDTPAQEIKFVQPDAQTYRSTQEYPTQYLELTGQNDLAGQSMADLTIYPLHYLPAEQKLFVVTSITFTIEGTEGYIVGDYLPRSLSRTNHDLYQHMIQDMVILTQLTSPFAHHQVHNPWGLA